MGILAVTELTDPVPSTPVAAILPMLSTVIEPTDPEAAIPV